MVEVLIDEKVKTLVNTKFKSQKKEIVSSISSLKENPKKGDFVFGISNVECRELKIKGIRIFTVQYKNILYVATDDTFKDSIKVVDIAKKNKSKEQQKIIDEIKERVKSFGMEL